MLLFEQDPYEVELKARFFLQDIALRADEDHETNEQMLLHGAAGANTANEDPEVAGGVSPADYKQVDEWYDCHFLSTRNCGFQTDHVRWMMRCEQVSIG